MGIDKRPRTLHTHTMAILMLCTYLKHTPVVVCVIALCDSAPYTHTNVHIRTHHSTSLPHTLTHADIPLPLPLPHTHTPIKKISDTARKHPHPPPTCTKSVALPLFSTTPTHTPHTPTHPPTCNKSVALPLFSTSISSVLVKKSLNTLESLSGFCRSGVPFVAIR